MPKLNFNQGWRFYRGHLDESAKETEYDDSMWEGVCLPHSVRIEPVMASGMVNYQGDAWYRKHFIVSDNYKDKKIFIRFEAAMHEAKVWVNGKYITAHYGGYLPFIADISDYVDFGKTNVVAVKVNNEDNELIPPGKPQIELDFCYFGGLYRDAYLIIKNNLHITDPIFADVVGGGGVFVTYSNVSEKSAAVNIKTHIENSGSKKANATLKIKLGDIVSTEDITIDCEQTVEKTIKIDNPKLWSPDNPNLYNLTVEIIQNGEAVDSENLQIGIKDIRFTKTDCIINGKKVLLTGINRHQEYPYIGNALPASLHWRDAKLIKNAGWNIVRTGHYPSSTKFLDACDKLGILVITPTPGWQFFPNKDQDVFISRSVQNVREMVRHTRNHACVGFWEPILNEEGRTPDIYRRKTYNAVHEEYPGDNCYCAIDEEYDTEGIYDIIYKKTHEKNPHKPGFTREFADNWKEQYEGYEPKLYRVNRAKDAFGGFYNGGEKAMLDNMLARTVAWTSDGYQTPVERSCIGKYIRHNKGLDVGFCIWAGIDHNRGYCSNPASVGAIDFFRIPKYQYYASMSLNKNGKPMIFIASNLTYKSESVWVVSNCDNVMLYADNILIDEKPVKGDKNLPSYPLEFKMSNDCCELKAQGIIKGKIVAEHVVRRAGKPHSIKLFYDDMGCKMVADGSDKLMVYASVIDDAGNVCAEATNEIKFSVSGCGRIVGDRIKRVGANPVRAQAGIIGVLLESTKEAGNIILKAKAADLESDEIVIKTQPSVHNEVPYIDTQSKRCIFDDEKEEIIISKGTVKNIALHKKVSSSSGNALCGNDGRYNTDWAADELDERPEWIVDLGEEHSIGGVRIAWSEDGTTYDFKLFVKSENEEWIEKINSSATGQNIAVIPLFADNVRYVKVNILKVSKGVAAFSEFEVYPR